jgi:AcrR family transcriptional regulator
MHMQIAGIDEELVAIGLKPVLQNRSRETRLRLLKACHALVEKDEFASLSIEQVCQQADCSIGAFYNHFPTKDVLLQALVIWICVDAREAIDQACRETPAPVLLRRLMNLTVANYRERQAFLRAVTGAALGNRNVWLPIRRLGQHLVNAFIATKAPALTAEEEARLRFAFQAVFGLLNNELTNEPGPFGLAHPQLVDRICALIEDPSLDC